MCSVLSNHHSPSRDIANAFAGLERFKHQVSDGWWKNQQGNYTRAGPSIVDFLKIYPDLQRCLGWAEDSVTTSIATPSKFIISQI